MQKRQLYQLNRKLISPLVVFMILATVILAASRSALADSASLSLAPSTGKISPGGTLSVGIVVNSSGPVNAVAAHLAYSADSLDYVGANDSAAFSIEAVTSGGSGAVDIERGALPAVSGQQSLATVVFRVKSSNGATTINFTSNSLVVSANNNQNILTQTQGGKYVVGKATTTAPQPVAASTLQPQTNSTETINSSQVDACQGHEQDIKNVMARIIDRSQKQLNLFTAISNEVQTFYKENGKTLSNYDALVSDENAKQTAASLDLSTLKVDSGSFSCSTSPKASVTTFMNDLKSEIKDLSAYRTSVKNLINGVKSVDGQ